LTSAPRPQWGQAVSTGTIVGTVTDNSGAVVAAATVTPIDKATGDTRTTTTNDVGHHIFPNVNPSTYTIKFKKSGFAELGVANATVNVGTQLTENVQMKLGSVSTTVTVTETECAQLQTLSLANGTTGWGDISRRLGIPPETRKIACQRKDPLALLRIRDLAVALALIVLLGFGEQAKFLAPVRFLRSGDQTILRVHAEKASPR
jgi:Carboxypeptidase regulatory-like domain